MATADGVPTPLYHVARELNRDFAAIACQLQTLQSLGVYHAGMLPPGTSPLPEDGIFILDPPEPIKEYVSPKPVEGFLLGYFGKMGSPSHILVVNLDYAQTATKTIVGPDRLEIFDTITNKWSAVGDN